jgi:hypothetical protein
VLGYEFEIIYKKEKNNIVENELKERRRNRGFSAWKIFLYVIFVDMVVDDALWVHISPCNDSKSPSWPL